MFRSVDDRMQTIAHAARGHEGSIRKVYDDIYARLNGASPGAGLASRCVRPSICGHQRPARRAGGRHRAACAAGRADQDRHPGICPSDGYGANGKPNVAAIEAALGENITADDRDRVWAAMNEGDDG